MLYQLLQKVHAGDVNVIDQLLNPASRFIWPGWEVER